jgi:hypothetical protein
VHPVSIKYSIGIVARRKISLRYMRAGEIRHASDIFQEA